MTPRLRSSCCRLQERPLAVALTQVDEVALASARAEYAREAARVRAKRLRQQLQESADWM